MNFEQNCIVDLRNSLSDCVETSLHELNKLSCLISHPIILGRETRFTTREIQLRWWQRWDQRLLGWSAALSLSRLTSNRNFMVSTRDLLERGCLTKQEHPSLYLFTCAYFKLEHLVHLGKTNKQKCKHSRWVHSSRSKPDIVSSSLILSLYENYYFCL